MGINYRTPDGDIYRPPKKREPAGPAAKNLLAWEYSPESRELRQLIAFIEESAGAES